MGESNGQLSPPLLPLGAIHVAAGAHVADLPPVSLVAPPECLYWQELDCTGDDGQADMLGNDTYGDCVPVSVLRLAQLACPYPRKPTLTDASALFERWNGRPLDAMGTETGPAFDNLCQHGYYWAEQDLWVPRRFVIMRDGMAPDTNRIRMAISAFRGVQCSIDMPRDGFDFGSGFHIPPMPQSEGGHSIALVGYTRDGDFMAYSWGGCYRMPLSFLLKFAVEVNAFPSRWLTPERMAAHGMDWDRLMAVASAVAT